MRRARTGWRGSAGSRAPRRGSRSTRASRRPRFAGLPLTAGFFKDELFFTALHAHGTALAAAGALAAALAIAGGVHPAPLERLAADAAGGTRWEP